MSNLKTFYYKGQSNLTTDGRGCFQILLQHYIPEFYYKGQRLPEAISIEGGISPNSPTTYYTPDSGCLNFPLPLPKIDL